MALLPASMVRMPADHDLAGLLDPELVAAHTYESWYERGVDMLLNEDVLTADVHDDHSISLVVRSQSNLDGYVVIFIATDEGVLATCDCPVAERHRSMWCKHRVASALHLLGDDEQPVPPKPATEAFATGRPARNVPVAWTLVSETGSVRHLAAAKRPLCHAPGEYLPATTDLPLCQRCVSIHDSVTRAA